MTTGPATRIGEIRRLTRSLNLHVPPSYFASSTYDQRYEDAVEPIIHRPAAGPMHLYVGVPLCEEHCRFCMYFYGLADSDGVKAESCLRGLERFFAALAASGPVRSVAGSYIGGGTPAVLSAGQITRLLAAVNSTFTFEPMAQRTFEMSPRTASSAKVAAIVAGGYDRISFGVQSLDPAVVSATGRTFATAEQVRRLLAICRDAGVVETNVDLMVGLAEEGDDTLAHGVAGVLAAGCDTVSIYRYRPAERSEVDRRGGVDAYVARCAARVRRAVAVAQRSGWYAYGRADGEHIRLASRQAPRWPERNLYETRFQPALANSLVGVGVAGRSFLRNERMVLCPYQRRLGYELVRRPVKVEVCDPPARVAAALVNGLFSQGEVDVMLIETECGLAPEEVFADEFEYLLADGALIRAGSLVRVAEGRRTDWSYLDKLFYPPAWLDQRVRSAGLRIR